jgi:hypothetical protein
LDIIEPDERWTLVKGINNQKILTDEEGTNVNKHSIYVNLPILPTMVAKINTPARKSATTNKYSVSFSGVGVSPIVVSVRVDQ